MMIKTKTTKRAKMRLAVVAALYCVFLPCLAQDFNCTVAQDQDAVIYRISDESRPADYNASKCSYIWINATGHTIASDLEKNPFLLESSINKLMSPGCMENIVCKQHCKSETTGFGKDFMANCTLSCPGNNSSLVDKRDLIHGTKDGWSIFWIIAVVVVTLVGLGLLYTFRNRIRSTCSCRRYRSVRRQDTDQPQAEPV